MSARRTGRRRRLSFRRDHEQQRQDAVPSTSRRPRVLARRSVHGRAADQGRFDASALLVDGVVEGERALGAPTRFQPLDEGVGRYPIDAATILRTEAVGIWLTGQLSIMALGHTQDVVLLSNQVEFSMGNASCYEELIGEIRMNLI